MIVFSLLVVLFLAYLLSIIAKYFSLPRVVGQIGAGILLGLPIIKPYLFDAKTLSFFDMLSELGILLLFFFIGLEINLTAFKKNIKESFYISFWNTIISLVLGYTFSYYVFGFSHLISLLIGIAICVSSQAISMDILEEMKLVRSKIGTLLVSSSAVDDLFELILITGVLIFFQVSIEQKSFLLFFGQILTFIILIMIFKAWLIPWILKIFEQEKSRTYLFMGSFIIILLIAYLAELLGISSMVGAFIAGMLVRYTLLKDKMHRVWEEHSIAQSIHTISFGFLVPIFFVWVGLNTHINAVFEQFWLILLFVLIDIVGTIIGTMIGVKLSGGKWFEGYTLGWGIIPKGDTELIMATIALDTGIINDQIFALIVMMAFITTIIGPIMFKYTLKKYNKKLK